jgi:U3 small nucleolar RNA-associated protein 15
MAEWRYKSQAAQVVGAVTSLDFCAAQPHDFCASAGTRLHVFDGTSSAVKRQFARFKDKAYGGSFRRDGRLIVAGGEDAVVQVFDSGSRALLRQLKGHKAPVHVARFAADQLHVLSGGDDGVVAVWDVTSGQQVSSMLGHSDYVRSAVCSPASEEVWATSGYDHICKLWDARQRRCLLSVNHGAPIESAAFFPSGSLLVTAGGSDLCIWHVLQSGQLVQRVTAHQKTVTSVAIAALAGPQPHVVSAGLDGHVKVRMGHRRGLVACCVLLQSHHRIALRCAGFRLGNFSAIHCAQIPGAGAVPGRLACC